MLDTQVDRTKRHALANKLAKDIETEAYLNFLPCKLSKPR